MFHAKANVGLFHHKALPVILTKEKFLDVLYMYDLLNICITKRYAGSHVMCLTQCLLYT